MTQEIPCSSGEPGPPPFSAHPVQTGMQSGNHILREFRRTPLTAAITDDSQATSLDASLSLRARAGLVDDRQLVECGMYNPRVLPILITPIGHRT